MWELEWRLEQKRHSFWFAEGLLCFRLKGMGFQGSMRMTVAELIQLLALGQGVMTLHEEGIRYCLEVKEVQREAC